MTEPLFAAFVRTPAEAHPRASLCRARPWPTRLRVTYIMETMQANARSLAERIAGSGEFALVGDDGVEQLPLVAFRLTDGHDYDEFDVATQLAAERGWMVPAYTLPPQANHVTIMRALVKLTLGHTLATTLADDIAQACDTLLDFFRRSVELAERCLRPGQRAAYTIQTNGTLIDEDWAAFFRERQSSSGSRSTARERCTAPTT